MFARIPILGYHRIESAPPGREGDGNHVSPALFARHVSTLARLGFRGVTISDIVRWQRGEAALPRRPIAITFDDGYESVHTEALPVLAQHGWPATVFMVTGHVGGWNVWDTDTTPARLLDSAALGELAAAGREVGAHTRHHRRVTTLNGDELRAELDDARQDLSAVVGRPVQAFAFPYGTHSPAILRQVRAAGYTAAVTLKRWANGLRANPLRLGRAGIGGDMSPGVVVAKIAKMYLTPSRA